MGLFRTVLNALPVDISYL